MNGNFELDTILYHLNGSWPMRARSSATMLILGASPGLPDEFAMTGKSVMSRATRIILGLQLLAGAQPVRVMWPLRIDRDEEHESMSPYAAVDEAPW